MAFNLFDLFVVIVTLGLALMGFKEGLVRGAVKLAGFIALVVLMAVFSRQIVNTAEHIGFLPRNIAIPLAFILILIIGTCVFHIIAHVLHKLVHMTPAGFIDNGLGCALGIIKSLFLCGLAAIIISFAPPGGFLKNQYESSLTAKHLVTFISETIPLVKKAVTPYYRRIAPEPHEPEQKQDDRTISPNLI